MPLDSMCLRERKIDVASVCECVCVRERERERERIERICVYERLKEKDPYQSQVENVFTSYFIKEFSISDIKEE